MVTSLPRIHVAVMGIEKVIPSMADLDGVPGLLARERHRAEAHVLHDAGARPAPARRADGPEELHVVLLDNGRSRQIAGDAREALYCLRCGACLNACPVYRQIGGHAYGDTYPGPIGILLTAMLKGPR